jgi:MGT family glycosyltransferase
LSKIAIVCTPAFGHVIPMLGPIAELIRRGHDVVVYNSPQFEQLTTATGARFVAYPPALDMMDIANALKRGNHLDVYPLLLEAVPALADFTLAAMRADRPDVVVYDAVAMWGSIAARTLGIRSISDSPIFVFEVFRHMVSWREFWGLVSGFVPKLPRVLLAYARMLRFGIDKLPVAVPLYPVRGDKDILLTSRELHPQSPIFRKDSWVFTGASIDARTRPDTFDFSRLDGRPVIFISMGTLQFVNDGIFNTCLEAFADYPAQFLLAAGPGSDITRFGAIPENFIVQQTFPQMPLLERTALFITHAGLGSIHETLWNGVPFVAVPQQFEQMRNALAAARKGAGVILDDEVYGRPVDANQLRHAVDTVFADPAYRASAQRLGETLKAPGGYVKVADVIEEMAAGQ